MRRWRGLEVMWVVTIRFVWANPILMAGNCTKVFYKIDRQNEGAESGL